jgi:hypothetical protein
MLDDNLRRRFPAVEQAALNIVPAGQDAWGRPPSALLSG